MASRKFGSREVEISTVSKIPFLNIHSAIYALAFIGLLLISLEGNAQDIKWGARAGLNFSNLDFDSFEFLDKDGIKLNVSSDGVYVGYHVGVFSQIGFTNFPLMFNPEILYSTTGGKIKIMESMNGAEINTTSENQIYGRLEVPLIVALDLSPFRVSAGPVPTFFLSNNKTLTNLLEDRVNIDISDNFDSPVLSFQIAFGMNLGKKFAIDLKYEDSFSGETGVGQGVILAKPTSQQFIFSLGYFLNQN